ncbi:hypothetical protein CGJ37_23730 [Vibrio parahaemolyticus]|nr:hypothetical protein CGJ37_23730 [Vibrio parahaemolyticus]
MPSYHDRFIESDYVHKKWRQLEIKGEEDKSNELTEPSCENLGIVHFLALLEKDIEQHTDKLVVPSHEMKE